MPPVAGNFDLYYIAIVSSLQTWKGYVMIIPMNKTVKNLVYGALIAALYAALTLALQPISFGLVQLRVSEAFCVLPALTACAVPGLTVGCLLASFIGLFTGVALLPDVIFGTLATLLAAICTRFLYRTKWNHWLYPLPAVVFNAVMVGALLYYVYDVGVALWLCMVYVGAGQAAACYLLGMPLYFLLKKHGTRLFG